MSALALALALFAAQADTTSPAPPPEAAADSWPAGAPREDYQFVGWCYGALRGYLELHDQVMPEVTRIETTYRRPGSSLADDMKVYADMQRSGQSQLKVFQGALTAAEKASLTPINAEGAEAVRRGRSIWNKQGDVSKARLAQEWMSWTLPKRCETTASSLQLTASMKGAAFRVNSEPASEAAPQPAPEAQPVVEPVANPAPATD